MQHSYWGNVEQMMTLSSVSIRDQIDTEHGLEFRFKNGK